MTEKQVEEQWAEILARIEGIVKKNYTTGFRIVYPKHWWGGAWEEALEGKTVYLGDKDPNSLADPAFSGIEYTDISAKGGDGSVDQANALFKKALAEHVKDSSFVYFRTDPTIVTGDGSLYWQCHVYASKEIRNASS